ncbi:HlyD family secretion protein [Thiorhodovibrio frisius]|uniref:Multidrug resistance efflux pump n=1 Tax=Thiorhodovibrio frisius TaxID=631362 RepID=H8Z3A4_9GAMM|nr:HlyD family efflux transporter periplasmic adaptor subunit [Thiorhodovibrio frisius]EIC21812.1 multidrug resistance efflux pump [Thiorhodovibrio frisius]WPL21782.1 putative efflux pump membrane fusion protein [Thiorhodovibrio frisius]
MTRFGNRSLTIWLLLALLLLASCGQSGPPLALGTLERDRIALTATVAEVVVALPVAEGSKVTEGTVLVRLNDRLQRAEVERAKAEVARAQAELLKLRNGARPEEIAIARAKVAGAEAALREAEITYQRNQDLIERKSVSKAELDRTLALRDGAQATLDQARQALNELLAGTRAEDVQAAEAELAAAKAKRDYEQGLLAELTITATRDGRLDSLPWNLGERVTAGSPVAVMLAGKAPYARVYVPEPHRVKVKQGDRLTVRIDGLAEPITGAVRWISSEPAFTPYYALNAEDRSRLMFSAEVQLPDSAADLPNGVPVQVELP